MSMVARLAGQDAVQLVRIAAAVSLTLTDTERFSYNFPLMLFGIVALELSSTGPEQFFIMLTAVSGIFDLFFLFRPRMDFTFLFALVVVALKAPIYFSGLAHLRDRGGEFTWAAPRGFTAGGWMPSSGGQTLGSGEPSGNSGGHTPPPPGAFPSGGYRLGGDNGAPRPPQTRDGYSAIA